MRRPRHKLQVSTFPFLAVLLCAMGSLILFLLVIDRRAKLVARNKALQAQQESAERRAARTAQQAEQQRTQDAIRYDLLTRRTQLEGETAVIRRQLDTAASQLDARRASHDDLRRRLTQEQANVVAAEESLKQKRAAEAETTRKEEEQDRRTRTERARLTHEVQQMEASLRQLQARKNWARNVYSLVPYGGKRGAARRPIYVECTRDGLVVHPGRAVLSGPASTVLGLRAEIESRSGQRLRRAIPGSNTTGDPTSDPYILFLVRPEGIHSYQDAQTALHGLQVDFGYELIDSEWVLDFPAEGRPQTVAGPTRSGIGGSMPGGVGPGGTGLPGNGGTARGQAGQQPPGLGPPGTGSGIGGAVRPGWPSGAGGGVGPRAGVPGGVGGSSLRSGPLAGFGTPGQGHTGAQGSLIAGTPGKNGGGPGSGGSGAPPEPFARGGGGTAAGLPGGRTGPGGSVGGGSVPRPFALGGSGSFGRGGSGGGFAPLLPPGATGPRQPISSAPSGDVTWKPGSGGGGAAGPYPAGTPGTPGAGGQASAAGPLLQRPVPLASPGAPSADRVIASANVPGTPARPGTPAGSGQPPRPGATASPPDGGARSSDQPTDPDAAPAMVGGQPGAGGEAGPLARHLLPLPPEPRRGPQRAPSVRVFGSRDFQITIDCFTDHVRIMPGGATFRWPTGDGRATDAALARYVVELIRRRQAMVRPGEPPYQSVLLLNVNPGGQRTYLRAYPALEPLRLRMQRESKEE